MNIKLLIASIASLTASFAFAAPSASPTDQCKANFNAVKSQYTTTAKNLEKFTNEMNKFKWVHSKTISAVRTGAANEANSFNSLYPTINSYQQKGDYAKCAELAKQTNLALIEVNKLLDNVVIETKNSVSDYPKAKKEAGCSTDQQCSELYDAVSQVYINKALESYQKAIAPILQKMGSVKN